MAQRFGIDISSHQGNFDIESAVKAHGVQFAILKIGGGDKVNYKDKKFEANYKKCKEAGIPVGVYFFGYATTMDKAKSEAAYLLQLLAGKQFEFPIFYDVEGHMLTATKRTLTDIIKYVMKELEAHGYWAGIYSSVYAFNNNMYDVELKPYSHWVASWTKNKPMLSYGGAVQIWQFGGETNKQRSNKINGQVVDQNYCYVDYYESVIKQKGLNGYGLSNLPTDHKKKSTREIALEVIDGKWGNGQERKDRLTAAGYNYKTVQNMVNKILKEGK